MMDDVKRKVEDLRKLWEEGRLLNLDWADLEEIVTQAEMEHDSLVSHVNNMREEMDKIMRDLPGGR